MNNQAIQKLDAVIELLKQHGPAISERAALALIDVRAMIAAQVATAAPTAAQQDWNEAIEAAILELHRNADKTIEEIVAAIRALKRSVAKPQPAARQVSDEQIVAALFEIDAIANLYDAYEFGLPTHHEKTCQAMITVVRALLAQEPK